MPTRIEGIGGLAGDVRRQQHVCQPRSGDLGERLDRIGVERSAGKPAVPQRGDQGMLVHQFAARGVDQHSTRFHRGDGGRIEDAGGLRRQPQTQGDDVGTVSMSCRGSTGTGFGAASGRRDAATSTVIPKAPAICATRRPSRAVYHDAERAAFQRHADQRRAGPVAGAHPRIGLRDFPQQSQQQGDGVFRDRAGIRRAGGRHDDAARGGGGKIDAVAAGAVARDDAQARRGRNDVGGDDAGEARQDRVGWAARFGQRLLGRIVVQDAQRAGRRQAVDRLLADAAVGQNHQWPIAVRCHRACSRGRAARRDAEAPVAVHLAQLAVVTAGSEQAALAVLGQNTVK